MWASEIIAERSHFCFPLHLNMIIDLIYLSNLIYFIPYLSSKLLYLYQSILIHYILITYNNFYLLLTFYNFYFKICDIITLYLLRWYQSSSDFIELYEKLISYLR